MRFAQSGTASRSAPAGGKGRKGAESQAGVSEAMRVEDEKC